MRKRFDIKYLVILGLVLAGIQTWWTAKNRRPEPEDEDNFPIFPAVRAHAREITPVNTTITPAPVTNWPAQLGAVLTSSNSSVNQAVSLVSMFPNLPPEAQLEAAQHTTRLLPGEYFGALGVYLTNQNISPAVRRTIFADLLTRPNTLKLPWLVEVAQGGDDQQAKEALFLLQSHLREDYGTDWNAWRERVAVWLSQNPD